MDNKPIDFVITWVDSSDPVWIDTRNRYLALDGENSLSDSSDARFRDWDTVKYLFRSIDKFTPWVRKVHFVTAGHLPVWLNTQARGLNIVKHEDFIPSKYLPTFSSHTIELNLHRIDGLADQFVNINDDVLFLRRLKPEFFFKKGLPCDYAVLDSLMSTRRFSTADIGLTDVEIINDHFNKNTVIKKNFLKWFNLHYGKYQMKTILMMPWRLFCDFQGKHFGISYLKKTYTDIWEKEYEVLDKTCSHKFRTGRDVNQWLIRDWQLVSGNFIPTSPTTNKYYVITNDNKKIIKSIKKCDCKMICINDVNLNEELDIERIKKELKMALESVFPEKSRFEI